MKQVKIIFGIAAMLAFAAGSLHAGGGGVNSVISFSASALVQGAQTDDGTFTTAAKPSKFSVSTKTLLHQLALDKGFAPDFVSGAKLVAVGGTSNFPDFQVWDKGNNFIVDVSDILSIESSQDSYGSNVQSGKQYDNTGVGSPSTSNIQLITLVFDDTGAPYNGPLQFILTGVMNSTNKDTTPSAGGTYTETQSNKLTSGAGDGNYNGNQLVITGNFTATGSGVLTTGT